jgi:uncharacterized protein (TIGR03086 family)
MSDDPRPLMARALDQIGTLVDGTRTADLDRPTPCDDWDVRTLLGHLVGVPRRVAHVGTGGSPFDVPSMVDLPDGEHAAALKSARADVDRVWGLDGNSDAVLDRMLTVPWGTMPGRAVGFGYVQEFTVHAWDLAVATGRADELDPSLAEACEPVSRQMVPADTRGGPVPFGPVVEVRGDAGPYDRLVGWLGRDPGAV